MLKHIGLLWRRLCATSLMVAFPLSAAPKDPFKQLDDVWPTPDATRRASGAPGPGYWQQRADYVIDVELDEVMLQVENGKVDPYSAADQVFEDDSLLRGWLFLYLDGRD